MIAVILNYESRQNPAYRSTLARTFLRDLRSHLCAILPRRASAHLKSVPWF